MAPTRAASLLCWRSFPPCWLRYDGLTDGGVPVSPAAYTVTVYSAPAEKGRTFGVDSQGRVYQDNRRYSASPEQVEELTALLKRICS